MGKLEISPAQLAQYGSRNTWNIIEGVSIWTSLMSAHTVATVGDKYIFDDLLGLFLHSTPGYEYLTLARFPYFATFPSGGGGGLVRPPLAFGN